MDILLSDKSGYNYCVSDFKLYLFVSKTFARDIVACVIHTIIRAIASTIGSIKSLITI